MRLGREAKVSAILKLNNRNEIKMIIAIINKINFICSFILKK